MTEWGSDPALGSAHAVPVAADARATLNAPICDDKLPLAGEACNTGGLAGTVGGAFLGGVAAAEKILHGFPPGRFSV